MKKYYILTLLLIASLVQLSAQEFKNLNSDKLTKIKKIHSKDPGNTALINAVSNNNVKNLVLNRSVSGKEDYEFSHKVDVKGITDQKSSGRCWMFTGLNTLRPEVIRMFGLSDFEFSTNYLYFYDILEKSNLFLNTVESSAKEDMLSQEVSWLFRSPVGDGGVWNSLANLIEKYGLVPKAAMPETYHSQNTRSLIGLLNLRLREGGLKIRELVVRSASQVDVENEKIKILGDVYHLLELHLGTPPESFTWRYKDVEGNLSELKTYTPLEFKEALFPGLDFDNYVMFMNDPTREYYKLYEINLDRNVMEGRNWKYINLPMDELKIMAIESIKANKAMYMSCDVGKQLNKTEGLLDVNNYDYSSLFNISFGMDKKQRIQSFASASTHGMALVAVDLDKDGNPLKWQVENSWGVKAGHNGYLSISDEWLNEYLFRLVVQKEFIPKKILKILESEAILLPAWDPMFSTED